MAVIRDYTRCTLKTFSSQQSEEALALLDDTARAATLRHRTQTTGASSFGFKTREVKREFDRRRLQRIDNAVAACIASDQDLAIVSEPQVHGTACVQAIQMIGETPAGNNIHALSEYQRAFAKAFRARSCAFGESVSTVQSHFRCHVQNSRQGRNSNVVNSRLEEDLPGVQ